MFTQTVTVVLSLQMLVTAGTRQYSLHLPPPPVETWAATDCADSGVPKNSSSSSRPSNGTPAPNPGFRRPTYSVALLKTDPAGGSRGISIFAVEKGTPGLAVARRLDKLGWRSSDTAELVFQDCRVPAANLVGEEHRGFYAIMRNFQNERIAIAAMATGEASRALELTLEYVRTRKAFGAPLWDKQAIRQKLSMLAAKVEAGRRLVEHAALLDAAGGDCVKEVSMAKAYCGELVNEVMYACLQCHGGAGYMRETPIERMFRDARVQSIGGGATEVMLEEVAKRL